MRGAHEFPQFYWGDSRRQDKSPSFVCLLSSNTSLYRAVVRFKPLQETPDLQFANPVHVAKTLRFEFGRSDKHDAQQTVHIGGARGSTVTIDIELASISCAQVFPWKTPGCDGSAD